MQYSIYSDLEWTYPDSPFIPLRPVLLETARGGHAAFQLLGETLPSQTALCVSMEWETQEAGNGLTLFTGELLPVGVGREHFRHTHDYNGL